MKIIYENDYIIVKSTDNNTDFIATIENKTNNYITLSYFDEDGNNIDQIDFEPKIWVWLLAGEDSELILKSIANKAIKIIVDF